MFFIHIFLRDKIQTPTRKQIELQVKEYKNETPK